MTALTDPENLQLRDIAEVGDAFDDPQWRAMLGLGPEGKAAEHPPAPHEPDGATKAASPDSAHTGAMVALIPTEADAVRLAVDGGEDSDELHLTLLYLGKAADIPNEAQQRILSALRSAVEDAIRPDLPLLADGFAISAFNPGNTDREPCIVLGVGGKELAAVHAVVLDTVGEVRTTVDGLFPLPEQHRPWTPHITLIYTDDVGRVEELADRTGPIAFDRLRVSFAEQVTDIPLTSGDDDQKSVKHLPGRHNQDSHGEGLGVDAIPGDKLKLAGRISLGDGESLVGSDVFKTRDSGLVPMALTQTPSGPRLRLGTGIQNEDQKRWAGRNLGSTVNLDEAGMRQFRDVLDEMHTRGDEGGRKFRAIEDQEEALDQQRRDILKRQHPNLSKAERKRLDQIDRRLEQIEGEIEDHESALRRSADFLAREEPDKRPRWDDINAEIAELDPQRDRDRIEMLQMEQARMLPSPTRTTLERMRAPARLRQEREGLQAERGELTADPIPLSPEDQVDLDRVDAEIADNEAQRTQMRESVIFGGVIPGEWADLVYEVSTHETTHEYSNYGIEYRIAARPKNAGPDWYPSEDSSATELEPKELAKLAAMLDQLSGDRSKSGRRQGAAGKHSPGGHPHNQQSHAGDGVEDEPAVIEGVFGVVASAKVKTKLGTYHLASLIDREGRYGNPGGRVLALAGSKVDWGNDDETDETVVLPIAELDAFSDALSDLAAKSKVRPTLVGEEIGGVLVGRNSVGGVEMAAYNDWGGDLVGEGDGVVALAFNGPFVIENHPDQIDKIEWQYLLEIGSETERLEASEVDPIVDALWKLAADSKSVRRFRREDDRKETSVGGNVMSTKSFQPTFKAVDSNGEGTATFVIATLNEVDKDGDVTLPGFFGRQHVQMVPAHDWAHVWLGKGVIYEQGNEALCDVKFNLRIPDAKNWYEAVKFDYENPPALAQYSYGFDVLDGGSEQGMHKGRQVRYLKAKDDGSPGVAVHEVSPVLVGAGNRTRTVAVKSRNGRRQQMPEQTPTLDSPTGVVKGAIAVHESATIACKWDAAEMETALPEDLRPSQLRTVYAWMDPKADPELKASYKFAHHHGVGGPANLRACYTLIAALNRGHEDLSEPERKAVYDHLASHLRDADREPPELRDRGVGATKQYDELLDGLAIVSGLIDGAYSGAALRREKGRDLSKSKVELLEWLGDDLTRLKALLSPPVEPEVVEPSDEQIASVMAKALAHLQGM